MTEGELGDRQLDALLARLDRLNEELRAINRRLDSGEHLAPVVRELAVLNDSLQALAYAALGRDTDAHQAALDAVAASSDDEQRDRVREQVQELLK